MVGAVRGPHKGDGGVGGRDPVQQGEQLGLQARVVGGVGVAAAADHAVDLVEEDHAGGQLGRQAEEGGQDLGALPNHLFSIVETVRFRNTELLLAIAFAIMVLPVPGPHSRIPRLGFEIPMGSSAR